MIFATTPALGGEKKWYDRFELGGYADVYYAYNTNQPDSRDNFTVGEGSTAKKHNQFSLNLAALELTAVEPLIVHIVLNFGSATEVLHVGEPVGTALGPDVWKWIQQAYLGYRLPVGRGLTVEAGIFPSHVGYEVFPSKDNWNYTRSWMAENSPYYQAGVRVSYPFTDRLSAQVLYLNGWQVVGEDNNWKTFGTQLQYAHPRFTVLLNTLIGPEQPQSHDTWRFFFDGIATVNVSARLQLAATFDYGFEQLPGGGTASWYGGAGYARFAVRNWLALSARAEAYHDGLGSLVPRGLSGTIQTVYDGTLTVELRAVDHLIVKVEGRYDHSNQPVFDARGRNPLTALPLRSGDQGLVVVGAVATF